MASLSQGLICVLTAAKCSDDKFRAWLQDNEIVSPDGLGLLAATETNLEDKFFPMLAAAGVPMTNMAVIFRSRRPGTFHGAMSKRSTRQPPAKRRPQRITSRLRLPLATP